MLLGEEDLVTTVNGAQGGSVMAVTSSLTFGMEPITKLHTGSTEPAVFVRHNRLCCHGDTHTDCICSM